MNMNINYRVKEINGYGLRETVNNQLNDEEVVSSFVNENITFLQYNSSVYYRKIINNEDSKSFLVIKNGVSIFNKTTRISKDFSSCGKYTGVREMKLELPHENNKDFN